MRPHLAALDRIHHRRRQQQPLEARVRQGQDRACNARGEKDAERGRRVRQRLAEHGREDAEIEMPDAAGAALVPRVDQIVRAPEEIVEVLRERDARRIFAGDGEVRRGLAVQ